MHDRSPTSRHAAPRRPLHHPRPRPPRRSCSTSRLPPSPRGSPEPCSPLDAAYARAAGDMSADAWPYSSAFCPWPTRRRRRSRCWRWRHRDRQDRPLATSPSPERLGARRLSAADSIQLLPPPRRGSRPSLRPESSREHPPPTARRGASTRRALRRRHAGCGLTPRALTRAIASTSAPAPASPSWSVEPASFRRARAGLSPPPGIPADPASVTGYPAPALRSTSTSSRGCTPSSPPSTPSTPRRSRPPTRIRVVRALEVFAIREPLSAHHRRHAARPVTTPASSRWRCRGPCWSSACGLHPARCSWGWVEEVRAILADGYAWDAKPSRASATRRWWPTRGRAAGRGPRGGRGEGRKGFAKRQRTWFRRGGGRHLGEPEEAAGEGFLRATREFLAAE